MSLKLYAEAAKNTEAPLDTALITRASQNSSIRLMHASLGLFTEGAEFADALKKHVFYGAPLDKQNMAEELGDIMWYIALAADELDVDLDKILMANTVKLKSRYGAKFSQKSAKDRDLENEGKALKQTFNLSSDYADGSYAGE